jgi:kynurenine formamidase
MIATVNLSDRTVRVDLSKPIDISIPIREGKENVNAFYIPPVQFEAFQAGNFVGDVSRGGSCNVFSIHFNPHGNGTHTETVGHISSEKYPIYKCLDRYFFESRLITLQPEKAEADFVITRKQLEAVLGNKCPEALVIRTLPNQPDKVNAHYSGTNPPYLESAAADFLRNLSVRHLLLDLPSIDKEDDEGKLAAHRAFWNYPASPRTDCTITELAYIPDMVKDGFYLLNLQVVSFDNDASPSKPLLFKI